MKLNRKLTRRVTAVERALQVVKQRCVDGQSMSELAKQMSITRGRAYQIYNRGLRLLNMKEDHATYACVREFIESLNSLEVVAVAKARRLERRQIEGTDD